jgi:hypothetical protein
LKVTSQRAEHGRPRTRGFCVGSPLQGSASTGWDGAANTRVQFEAAGV